MGMNILDRGVRKNIVQEMGSRENRERKEESTRRFNVYRHKQEEEIIKKLEAEFSKTSVLEMRKLTSINLVERIINELASIYKREPERSFMGATPREEDQLNALYDKAQFNTKMKHANRVFKLQDQCAVHIWPLNNKLHVRALHPHQYDVIPNPEDPEIPEVYILSTFDKWHFDAQRNDNTKLDNVLNRNRNSDHVNQKIGDPDDEMRSDVDQRMYWWSKDWNFITDGRGEIVLPEGVEFSEDIFRNPIGRLPFIDISGEKDAEFFVKTNNSIVEFNLDFGKLLSDHANIIRLQGYSQALLYSETKPENFIVGPNNVLHVPLDPNSTGPQPRFEFATPSPDIQGGLNFLDLTMNLFQSSLGMDTSTLSTSGESKNFTSGLDRLLHMIQKFEATQDDIDLFNFAETEAFDIIRAWNNVFQEVSPMDSRAFMPELRGGKIGDKPFVELKYTKPEAVKSEVEEVDLVIRKMESGLMSRAEAIAQLRNIEVEDAMKIAEDIDNEGMEEEPSPVPAQLESFQPVEEVSETENEEDQ